MRNLIHSLRTRLIVMTLAFLLLPSGILGYLGYNYLAATIKNNNIRAVGHIADANQKQLTLLLSNTQKRADRFLVRLLLQCLAKSNNLQKACIQDELQEFINNEQAIGISLYHYNKTQASLGFIDNKNIPDFIQGQIGVFVHANNQESGYFYIQSRSKNYQLLIKYPLQPIQAIFNIEPNLGESGDIFLVDNHGFFITQPRLLTTKSISESANDHALHHCLGANNAEILDIDRRNIQIIHSFRFIPEIGGGCIMAHLDQAEAFASLQTLRWSVIMITASLIIIAFIIALIVGGNISKPLNNLCTITKQIINGNYAVSAAITGDKEIAQLARAFNAMAEKLQQAFNEVHQQQEQLEAQVIARTQQLLLAKEQAENSLLLLQQTQENLIQAEKMAALGGLVAGVAHEINTPIGITLTSATFLHEQTQQVINLYQQNELDADGLDKYFDNASQASQLMSINCQRAASLIQSFKQVAVDQSSDSPREFRIKAYLEEVLLSLRPSIKKETISIQLHCPDDLSIHGYPGALSQIITNLLMNSLNHAYDNQSRQGIISIQVKLLEKQLIELTYSDDGKGISEPLQHKIFEPFFTTQRANGGSGLGLHIVYNIVHQTLKGTLRMNSIENQGTTFIVSFPQYL